MNNEEKKQKNGSWWKKALKCAGWMTLGASCVVAWNKRDVIQDKCKLAVGKIKTAAENRRKNNMSEVGVQAERPVTVDVETVQSPTFDQQPERPAGNFNNGGYNKPRYQEKYRNN